MTLSAETEDSFWSTKSFEHELPLCDAKCGAAADCRDRRPDFDTFTLQEDGDEMTLMAKGRKEIQFAENTDRYYLDRNLPTLRPSVQFHAQRLDGALKKLESLNGTCSEYNKV